MATMSQDVCLPAHLKDTVSSSTVSHHWFSFLLFCTVEHASDVAFPTGSVTIQIADNEGIHSLRCDRTD